MWLNIRLFTIIGSTGAKREDNRRCDDASGCSIHVGCWHWVKPWHPQWGRVCFNWKFSVISWLHGSLIYDTISYRHNFPSKKTLINAVL